MHLPCAILSNAWRFFLEPDRRKQLAPEGRSNVLPYEKVACSRALDVFGGVFRDSCKVG